jgi:4-amino-4-deoxy-L-arabinose transferase-like glycosyltransferase
MIDKPALLVCQSLVKNTQMQPHSKANALLFWRSYFAIASLLALTALVWQLGLTSAPGSRFLFVFSPARLVSLAMVAILLGAFIWLFTVSWTRPEQTLQRMGSLVVLLRRPRLFTSLLVLCSLLAIMGIYALTLTPEISEPYTAVILQRAAPLIFLLAGLSSETLLFLLLGKYGLDVPGLLQKHPAFWLALSAFGALFLLWSWVARTTLPTESAITGWNDLGAPVLETQVLLAWLVGLAVWGLILYAHRRARQYPWLLKFTPKVIDLIIVILLWSGTLILWNTTPAPANYFSTQPRPPNYEAYPNSDALVYDMSAQIMMLGQGMRFAGDISVRRPMLAVFFTILHLLGDQQTDQVIFWQIVFLATLPAFIYLLGKSLFGRLAGVIGAVIIALRGATAIALSATITVSHARLLMSDLPATLAMVILVYLAVRWLQTGAKILGMLCGGSLGLAMLIRPELGAAVVPIALVSLIVFRKSIRHWGSNFLLFTLGLLLMLSPWVYRNWSLTAQFYLDTPTFRADWLQERYQLSLPPTPVPVAPPAQEQGTGIFSTAEAGSSPVAPPQTTPVGPGAQTQETSAIIAATGGLSQVASFAITHFVNSQVQIFLVLPTTFRPLDSLVAYTGHRSTGKLWDECCSALNYARRLPYWRKWFGDIPGQALVPLLFTLALMALGISQSWKKQRWIGILPLMIGIVHLAVNALARNSGGRYILPVDWIGILYFSLGLAHATLWLANQFASHEIPAEVEIGVSAAASRQPYDQANIFRSPLFYGVALLLLAIGSLAPILERTFPTRYTPQVESQMLQALLASPLITTESRQSLEKLLTGETVVRFGRALYPRYFRTNQGEPGSPDPLEPQPYPRLGFYLANRNFDPIILPLVNQPDRFPNGADVMVIGCLDGQAAAVALFDSPTGSVQEIWFRSGDAPPLSCSP